MIVNFNCIGACFTSKWDKLCQQFLGAIRTTLTTSDIDRNIFPDPSSSISDHSEIGQTGTTHSWLCLDVLEWSHKGGN